jgi:hypothetical protein
VTERLTDESIAASTHTPAVTIRNRMVAAEAELARLRAGLLDIHAELTIQPPAWTAAYDAVADIAASIGELLTPGAEGET